MVIGEDGVRSSVDISGSAFRANPWRNEPSNQEDRREGGSGREQHGRKRTRRSYEEEEVAEDVYPAPPAGLSVAQILRWYSGDREMATDPLDSTSDMGEDEMEVDSTEAAAGNRGGGTEMQVASTVAPVDKGEDEDEMDVDFTEALADKGDGEMEGGDRPWKRLRISL